MGIFEAQVPVFLIQGSNCSSLRKFYKYLHRARQRNDPHIHARLFVEEVVGVEEYICPVFTKTLLLQPCILNWNPYAILRNVAWLRDFDALEHLEVSLDGEGAATFVHLLRDALPSLKALVVSTNEPCPGFWSSVTWRPRPGLVCLCVNGFRLEPVSLGNIANVRFLWINRPCKVRGTAAFMRRLSEDVPGLVYLTTRDFGGLAVPAELEGWLFCFEGSKLPLLKYWETDGCDIRDVATIAKFLRNRRVPLTVQGLKIKESCVHVPGGHRLLSTNRDVSLHLHRIYRSLVDVLGSVLHTKIPTKDGHTMLRGTKL